MTQMEGRNKNAFICMAGISVLENPKGLVLTNFPEQTVNSSGF